MTSISESGLVDLLDLLRRTYDEDPPVDDQQLVRMWLVTTDDPASSTAAGSDRQPAGPAGSGTTSVFLTEVHAASRLMSTPDGMAYLTPEGRRLVGVGWAIREVRVPSPAELHERLTAEVDASLRGESDLARPQRWRFQRLLKAMRRPSANPKRWAVFVLGNSLEQTVATRLGVCLADGRRIGVQFPGPLVGQPEAPGSPIATDAAYWQHNEMTPFAATLVAAGLPVDRDKPDGIGDPADVTLG